MRLKHVGLLAGAAFALAAAPASATIHPISCSGENSNAPAGTPAATSNPPGITNPPHPGAGPDQSRARTAQPLASIFTNPGNAAENAPKEPGDCSNSAP